MKELMDMIKAENAKKRAWVAEKPETRGIGLYIEDEQWWIACGVTNLEEFKRWEMLATISDLHKEAYGYRGNTDYNVMDIETLTVEYGNLIDEANRAEQQHVHEQEAHIAEFEASVHAATQLGAADRATAIRWLFQASEDENDTRGMDDEHFEYCNNLPYGYLAEHANGTV
tara:strand:- start:69393 stop:69905 length:513 start_codon:yes stop_codon:yes gene_type:complete